MPGFGEKIESRIVEAAQARLSKARRFKLAVAAQYAEPLVSHLRTARGVGDVVVAGSFRRMRETVGDLDILVTAQPSSKVMERFVGYEEVGEVLSHGETRGSVVLKCGLQVDVRVVASESYGAALHYFTGSKAHNIAIRKLALAKGLKVNEYGVFRGDKRVAGETEESVYASVGLPYIPPELRAPAVCRSWSSLQTSKATCTRTPRQATVTTASRKWRWPPRRTAWAIWRSPNTRGD